MRIVLFMTNPTVKTATLYLVSFAIGVTYCFIRALPMITHERDLLCDWFPVQLFSRPVQGCLQNLVRNDLSVLVLCHKECPNFCSDWKFSQTAHVIPTKYCQCVGQSPWHLSCKSFEPKQSPVIKKQSGKRKKPLIPVYLGNTKLFLAQTFITRP